MGFTAHWITLLLVSACVLVVHGQDNAQTRIPDSLMDCYRNPVLRNPENRPPTTMQTFIDIVRKIEAFQRGTVGMGELATSLLHSFRLDGIERTPGVVEAEGVLPFAVRGTPFFKHRVILRYLVPSNSYQFPMESLTPIERCTLHFMMSHTFDTTQRGDEARVCPNLANLESADRPPRHAIFKRQIEEDAATDGTEEEHLDPSKDAEHVAAEDTAKGLPGSDEHSEDTDNVPQDADESTEAAHHDDKLESTDKQAEAVNENSDANETKSGKYIFDDDGQHRHFPQQKARSEVEPEDNPEANPEDNPEANPEAGNEPQPRQTPTTESECPVESGVVYTRWGTVSLGPVIAGLVAGLYEQIVTLPDLVMRTPPVPLPIDLEGATIDNRFGATLAGDLAEAALEQGPKRPADIRIGLIGGWNSTIRPRWYFNREREPRDMTDAEIRGGLDGLVLGTNIRAWQQILPGSELRLSQLLSMYYSEDGAFSPQFRSCQRRDLYSAVAPNDILQEQSYRFAVVLDIQSITSASIQLTALRPFTDNAVSRLSSYLPQMPDRSCARRTTDTRDPISGVSLFTNVTVVIDRAWPHNQISNILFELASNLELSEFGSRLTVVDGVNGAPFVTNAALALDFDRNFTEAAYMAAQPGMDIARVISQGIQGSMEALLREESANNLSGGRSKIVLFIPFQAVNLNNNDLTIVRERMNHFRNFLPDVRFLYLAPGSTDNYRELVENVANDVISWVSLQTDSEIIQAVGQVTERIRRVPVRMMNPTCGADWNGAPSNNADFVHSVNRQGVRYHRLHPNYFFGVGAAQVTVLGASEDLRVCFSRRVEFPDNATNDVSCRQTSSGNVEIRMDNGCEGVEFISQCRPLFISVSPVRSGVVQPRGCTHECVLPTNIQYTIRNNGLGCAAGVGHLLSNRHLIVLTSALIFLVKYLNISS